MRFRAAIWVSLMMVLAPMARGQQELLSDRPPRMMEMTVEILPSIAALGDTVSILISATNRETNTMRLTFPGGCPFSFRITDSRGKAVEVRQECIALPESLVLAPGETVQDSLQVTGGARPVIGGTRLGVDREPCIYPRGDCR